MDAQRIYTYLKPWSKKNSIQESKNVMSYCTNGYRLWSFEDKRILLGRNVIFDEKKFLFFKLRTSETEWSSNYQDSRNNNIEEGSSDSEDVDKENSLDQEDQERDTHNQSIEETNAKTTTLRRSTRQRKEPSYFEEYSVLALNAETFVENVPEFYDDIKDRDDEDMWYQAIKDEMSALKKNDTWTLTKLPPGKRAIESK